MKADRAAGLESREPICRQSAHSHRFRQAETVQDNRNSLPDPNTSRVRAPIRAAECYESGNRPRQNLRLRYDHWYRSSR